MLAQPYDEVVARPAPHAREEHFVSLAGEPGALIRAFVAVDVAPDLLDGATHLANALREGACRELHGSWVRPDLMHVTVRFFGDVDDALAEALGARTLAAGARPRFRFRCTTLGAFPSPRRAHVLVLPLEDDGASTALARALDDEAATLGVPRETRPYVPHLTLARFRRGADVRDIVERTAVALEGDAEALTLYRSELGPRGPTYTALARATFR